MSFLKLTAVYVTMFDMVLLKDFFKTKFSVKSKLKIHCRRFVAKLVYKKSTLKKGDYIIFKAREVTRLLRHNVLALSFFDRVIP